jgi:hypothetical protein
LFSLTPQFQSFHFIFDVMKDALAALYYQFPPPLQAMKRMLGGLVFKIFIDIVTSVGITAKIVKFWTKKKRKSLLFAMLLLNRSLPAPIQHQPSGAEPCLNRMLAVTSHLARGAKLDSS